MKRGARCLMTPGASRSTMKSVGLSASPSTWAWTRMTVEALAEVTNHFSPERMYLLFPASPRSSAPCVGPAPGSVIA
jgi:hypothetical protein